MTVTRRLSTAAAAVLMAAPALAACGFQAQTDQVYNPGVGVNNRSGAVDVLAATVVSGSKGSGTVIAAFVNNNQYRGDKLVKVSGAGEDSMVQVQMGARPTIRGGGFVQLADLPQSISVRGSEVVPGRLVTLRFSFQNAQSVTLDVPVVQHSGDYANVPLPSSSTSTPTATPLAPTASPTPGQTPTQASGQKSPKTTQKPSAGSSPTPSRR